MIPKYQIRSLFPPGVVVIAATKPANPEQLMPKEMKVVLGASVKRQTSFATGRLCARQGLQQLGIRNFALLSGYNREPLWPTDILGSITHCGSYCATAISRNPDIVGLGIDIERVGALEKLPIEIVCTSAERSWLGDLPQQIQAKMAYALFSAKESLYKAIFRHHQQFIEFQQVELTANSSLDAFTLSTGDNEVAKTLNNFSRQINLIASQEFVYTGVTLYQHTE